LIRENSLKYSASNDFGKNFLGYKIAETHALFILTFVGYEQITNVSSQYNDSLTTAQKEERFNNDQLTARTMVRQMGRGNRDLEIRFANPIMIS
jgi:hypothetical protein